MKPAAGSVKHDTFHITRTLKASPARAFAAWSTVEAKRKWFYGGEGWTEIVRAFDFSEGGIEELTGRKGSGVTSRFLCRYHEIVPDTRIVYAYDMFLDGVRISVSLATIDFAADGMGTRLTITEQGAYLVGYDPNGDDHGSRLRGTEELIARAVALIDG